MKKIKRENIKEALFTVFIVLPSLFIIGIICGLNKIGKEYKNYIIEEKKK